MLTFKRIPCVYYPTTVNFIDDDKGFLSNIVLALDHKIITKRYTNPVLALNAIAASEEPSKFLNKLSRSIEDLSDYENVPQGYSLQEIKISEIKKEVNNPDRFSHISVLVVDYDMPEINGAEFCKKLENMHIKKIMLTGVAGYRQGVADLNNKLIDKFVVKTAEKMSDELALAIYALQADYFYEQTLFIRKNLDRSCIDNEYYIKLFNAMMKKYEISEFYLADTAGSFLLVDYQGNPFWFVVKSTAEINRYLEIARDNKAPIDIIKKLEQKQMIPFFLTEKDQEAPCDRMDAVFISC